MSDYIQDFLNDMGRYPLLTPEEELLLARQVGKMLPVKEKKEAGGKLTPSERRLLKAGERAYKRMILCNLRMVGTVARKYNRRATHLTLLDLVHEGVIGLGRAVEKYEPSRGYKFSTYAFWWIRQGVTRALATSDHTIRIPYSISDKLPRIRYAAQQLMQESGKEATLAQISKQVGIKVSELELLSQQGANCTSLDQPVKNGSSDNASSIVDLVADPNSLQVDDFEPDATDSVRLAIDTLEEREQVIITHRFGLQGADFLPFDQIGKKIGISRAQTQTLYGRAMNKLRLQCSRMQSDHVNLPAAKSANPKLVANLPSHRREIHDLVWTSRSA